ncbi:MAG: hypothetical protein IT500_08240 [Rubrivivax sp.]|nr:hypothetical protein [Rubrivivax sp.]
MPNALAKDLELMFENFVEGFDAACVISREAETSYPDATAMQRAGDTFYKKQNYHAAVVTGLDVSGSTRTDVIARFVPTVYRSPDNVIYELDAKELRDPQHMTKMGQASALRLAAEIDKNLYDAVRLNAAIIIKKVGALAWSDGATAEAHMIARGVGAGEKKLFMNPLDYLAVSGDLGGKAYMGDWSKDAYARSRVPDVATFKTFRTDNVSNLATVGTVTATVVSGNQSHTISAMTGDVPTDNRYGTLAISGANIANVKNGDCFTISGVNAVHMIDKSDTAIPMTFRVISGGGTGTLTITPKIVITGPYQNCSAQAANSAPLTFLNTATKAVNAFWQQGAVTLDFGRLQFPSGMGAEVMTANTKNGVPLVMVAQINAQTGKVFVRHTTLYAATVLDPEKCGLILANQV